MDVHSYRCGPTGRARVSSTRADDGEDDGVEMLDRAARRDHSSSGTHLEMETGRPMRISGRNASRYYAHKGIERDQAREKLRQEENTPKAIEKTLKEYRARPHRRGPLARCPNPLAAARSFLADPVTRFWLGCNVCTVLILFTSSVLFMIFLYPVWFRPTLKY